MANTERAFSKGSKVTLWKQGHDVYTIAGHHRLAGRIFYKLSEIAGALFLRESLLAAPPETETR